MMRKLVCFIIMCLASSAFAQCLTNIDYNNWTVVGNTAANWTIAPTGDTVFQSDNTGASVFLSNDTLYNVKVTGTFRSENGDDDWLGFVMGHRGVAPYQMYLFSWKQQTQGASPAGFSYWNLTNRYAPITYANTSPPNSVLIDSSYVNGYGWTRSQDHDFEMLYTSSESIILIDGDTIFENEGCFNPGKFGFYNSSQAQCSYFNFNFEIMADFFVDKDTICLGDSGDFKIFCDDVAPGYYDSVVWDFGDASPVSISSNLYNIKHQYTSVGTYTVNLTVKHKKTGCIATATQIITVEDQFEAKLGNDTAICHKETVPLTVSTSAANTITQYDWSDGSTNPVLMADSSKSYSVEVYNQYGCLDKDTIEVNVQDSIIINTIETDLTCFQNQSGEIEITAPLGNYDYQLGGSPFFTNPIFDRLIANTFTLTVRDSVGCTQDSIITINQPNAIILNQISSKPERCLDLCDANVVYTANGGTRPYTFTNSTGNQFNDSSFNQICDGTHKVYVNDVNGCQDSTTYTITPPTPITLTTTLDNTCIGAPSSISATATGGSFVAAPNYVYNWNNAQTIQGQTLFNEYPNQDTVYSVYALDDSLCSSDTLTIRINLDPIIDFTSITTSGCPDLVVDFNPVLGNMVNPVACRWSYGNSTIGDVCNNHQITYTNPGLYSVTYAVTTDKGCTAILSKGNHVEVFPEPEADFTFFPFEENVTVLNPVYNFQNTTLGGDTYLWRMDDLGTTTETNPAYSFIELAERIYDITLVSTSVDGCVDSITKQVTVENELFIYIPSAITPNGDGFNDLFKPVSNGLTFDTYEFTVFNRWGNVVYRTNNQNAPGWDGAPDGANDSKLEVYTWRLTGTTQLEIQSSESTDIVKEGIVTVIR